MLRIKPRYWITLIISIIAAIILIPLNHQYKVIGVETSNLIVAVMSFCVSILSLGFVTMKKPKFKGKVTIHALKNTCSGNFEFYQQKNDTWTTQSSEYTKFRIKIENLSQEDIKGLVITIRGGRSIVFINKDAGKDVYKSFYFGDTVIHSCNVVPILPNNEFSNYITLELNFAHKSWNRARNLAVMVSGENIESENYMLLIDKDDFIDKDASFKKELKPQ